MSAPVSIKGLINHSEDFQYPGKPFLKLAGRDFRVLTVFNELGLERWVFPENFLSFLQKDADLSQVRIGRIDRSNLDTTHLSTITSKDEFECDFDSDSLYKIEKIKEKGDFITAIELPENFEKSSTKITWERDNHKIHYLKLKAGDASIKFKMEEDEVDCRRNNKNLLDRFFVKTLTIIEIEWVLHALTLNTIFYFFLIEKIREERGFIPTIELLENFEKLSPKITWERDNHKIHYFKLKAGDASIKFKMEEDEVDRLRNNKNLLDRFFVKSGYLTETDSLHKFKKITETEYKPLTEHKKLTTIEIEWVRLALKIVNTALFIFLTDVMFG